MYADEGIFSRADKKDYVGLLPNEHASGLTYFIDGLKFPVDNKTARNLTASAWNAELNTYSSLTEINNKLSTRAYKNNFFEFQKEITDVVSDLNDVYLEEIEKTGRNSYVSEYGKKEQSLFDLNDDNEDENCSELESLSKDFGTISNTFGRFKLDSNPIYKPLNTAYKSFLEDPVIKTYFNLQAQYGLDSSIKSVVEYLFDKAVRVIPEKEPKQLPQKKK